MLPIESREKYVLIEVIKNCVHLGSVTILSSSTLNPMRWTDQIKNARVR